ncbi:MAG: hypothetical protein AAGH99_13245 [Planctomycetota bacterium]
MRQVVLLAVVSSLLPSESVLAQDGGDVDSSRKLADETFFTGEEVLSGDLGYPPSPSPKFPVTYDDEGLRLDRLSPVPPPGVHPRILFSPADLPDLRRRLAETEIGQKLTRMMNDRLDKGFRASGSWTRQAIDALIAKDFAAFDALIEDPQPAGLQGYNRVPILHDLELAAMDALLRGDSEQGAEVGRALAQWAINLEPRVDGWRSGPYPDHFGRWETAHELGSYGTVAWQQLGYAYDLAATYMAEEDRDAVRRVISKITKGTFTLGMSLPPHLRMWNWINCGNSLVLLSLAIEGEEGYEPRIYERGVEVLRDYYTWNYTPNGVSTEAVGYTSFGYLWGGPALAAMTRRGEDLITMGRYRAVSDWQLHTMIPNTNRWNSPGDGGNHSPSYHELMVRKFFYPDDPKVDVLYAKAVEDRLKQGGKGHFTMIDAMVFADDPGVASSDGSDARVPGGDPDAVSLGLPNTFVDEERGLIIARDRWSPDATVMFMTCQPDTFMSTHDHADRGAFNLMALGRPWTAAGFRSVESKHHNVVLVDGRGQGYFAAPGEVLDIQVNDHAAFMVSDTSYNYAWRWPKSASAQRVDLPKYQIERFKVYRKMAEKFHASGVEWEHETHPNVVRAFEGYDLRDSGMWDEDPWTVRVPHNPVERAFRTSGLIRGDRAYSLIVDDIQKDDQQRLYEWTMMLEPDLTAIDISFRDNPRGIGHGYDGAPDYVYTDIVIGRDTIKKSGLRYRPEKGEPLLLVRVLDISKPPLDVYDSIPSPRVETFEKKDAHSGPGGRTFKLDRRLIVPSRSVSPNFKIMLYPYRHGIDPVPDIDSPEAGTYELTWPGEDGVSQRDVISFREHSDGRTRMDVSRDGEIILKID